MSSPRVSITFLTWNHQHYIEQAIASLAEQSFRDFEIIFLDNCSSDQTKAVAFAAFRKYGLSFVDASNSVPQGVCANLNKMIRLATGDLIAPLSGDDWWAPSNLEEKVLHFEQHPDTGLLYSSGYTYYDDLGTTELMDTRLCKSGDVFQDLLRNNFVLGIGNVVPRAIYQEVGPYDESLKVEDWDMWLRIAKNHPVSFLNKPLVYYRRHSTSYSLLDSKPYFEERHAVAGQIQRGGRIQGGL